jgi:acetoin utilization deacetylase AcuC-like enzyme
VSLRSAYFWLRASVVNIQIMSSLAIIKDERYLEHNPGDGHPESPDRLRVIHDLIAKEFSDLPLIEPRVATEDELAAVHDPFYIQTVANTEGRAFSRLDADTGLSSRSYLIARLAAGGLLEAVDKILNPRSESVDSMFNPQSAIRNPQSVFAFVRPPGHHAEPRRGMGFCLFNNIAIAAEYAIEKHGLKRVLIVDWDLHHGNGTQKAFYDRPDVLFFSSHQYPHYPGTGNFDEIGSGKGEGYTVNAPFVDDRILKPIALEYKPELVLVSAGFDPYVKDPLGGMHLTGDGFGSLATIVREIADATCGGKVLITLEGGYNPNGLREGVRSVLQALTGPRKTVPVMNAPAAERVIQSIIAQQKKYWKSLT